jgi:anti-sigma regulatory factor (Ser/Thr protein kinase)
MPHPPGPPGPTAGAVFARAAAELDAFCAAERVAPAVAWRLRVALDELLANVLTHRDGRRPLPGVGVTIRRDGEQVEIVLTDDGPAFDPTGSPAPDLSLPLEARQPGGLGIHLVKTLIDEMRYERRGGSNVVTLRTRLDASGTTEPGAE